MADGTQPGAGAWGGRRRAFRMITLAILRAVGSTVALVAIYYLVPFDRASNGGVITALIIGLIAFVGLIALQVRSIIKSQFPGVRAVEALATSLPFFLLLYASTYLVMSSMSGGNFTEPLTHTDAMYFSLTVLSTVGFGDITAKSEAARLVVSSQMALDLVVLGLGIKIILGAVTQSRKRQAGTAGAGAAGN